MVQMNFSIGLQVCRSHRLAPLLAHLRAARDTLGCRIHIVVDRLPPDVRSILDASFLPYVTTPGIGNWTSKNVLLRACFAERVDLTILLEDDVEVLDSAVFEYLVRAYGAARQFLGFYKLNTTAQRARHANELRGETTLEGIQFQKLATFNTSAVLVIDRRAFDRIGYFCNSYFEMGFYDYRDRLRLTGLVDDLLSPSELGAYLRVDDQMPSTIANDLRPRYRSQRFPIPPDGFRPFNDQPATVDVESAGEQEAD